MIIVVLATSDSRAKPVDPQPRSPAGAVEIQATQMLSDVATLSGNFHGRQTGTAADAASAAYIADRFRNLGLRPAGQERLGESLSWFITQPVTVLQILETPRLATGTESEQTLAKLGDDYLPVLDSPSVNIMASVVFVGYGIFDRSGALDEYSGLDLNGKIALFLRGKPDAYPGAVTNGEKMRTAKEKGAVAYLTATGPILSGYEAKRGMTSAPLAYYGNAGNVDTPAQAILPGAWISTALAETLLAKSGRSLSERQEELNRTSRPQSIVTGQIVQLRWESTRTSGRLINVLGRIPGNDRTVPIDQQPTVVVGAHRDHFGQQGGVLFPGADDNASGTAVLLEVARILAQPRLQSKHSILFVSFSGEEPGLLGSRLYVSRPPYPLAHTLTMVNVDHAGVGNGRVTVGVSDVPRPVILQAGEEAGLVEQLDVFGFFPGGDHVPFKEAGIPTIAVVSGGSHPHFHRPTDRAETVNPQILEATARYLTMLTRQLANQ